MTLFKIKDYIKISLDREPQVRVIWKQWKWSFRIIWYGPKWRAFKARVKASRGA